MIYTTKSIEELMTPDRWTALALVREGMSVSGSVAEGYPAMLPMWRVEGGLESEHGEREELVAVRWALAKLYEAEEDVYALLCALALGKPLESADDALAALDGLDSVEAMVGEMLRDPS